LGRELHAARTAGQDGRVDELEPLHGLAADRVRYARSEAAARRTDYDTAHHTLREQAGPAGITTPQDVEFARIAATDLDVAALTQHRDTVQFLEGALLRAETHAARDYVRTAPALPNASTGAVATPGEQALTTATSTQGARCEHPAQPWDTAGTSELFGWRRVLGHRPDDPAQAQQWDFTVSSVGAYRSTYHVTSTDPTTPLGPPPSPGSEQAFAYRAIDREWRTMTVTNAANSPRSGDLDSEIQRSLGRLQERAAARAADKERAAHTEKEGHAEPITQDGITDERGFGYGTGYTDRHQGEGHGSHLGY